MTAPPPASPPLGRPKDSAKRAAMLAAAEALFFDHGFVATTLEAIADRANVSKVTLYGHFGDKAGLFEAVIRQVGERMETAMSAEIHPGNSLPVTLNSFGNALMNEIMSPHMIAFERCLTGELLQHPGIAQRLFDAGPGHMHKRLTAILVDAHDRGEVRIDDPQRAADDLFGLWQGFSGAETKFGVLKTPTRTQIKDRVAHGVELFMKAYAA